MVLARSRPTIQAAYLSMRGALCSRPGRAGASGRTSLWAVGPGQRTSVHVNYSHSHAVSWLPRPDFTGPFGHCAPRIRDVHRGHPTSPPRGPNSASDSSPQTKRPWDNTTIPLRIPQHHPQGSMLLKCVPSSYRRCAYDNVAIPCGRFLSRRIRQIQKEKPQKKQKKTPKNYMSIIKPMRNIKPGRQQSHPP